MSVKNDEKAVQGKRTPYLHGSPVNNIMFAIRQTMNEMSVAVPVTVVAVYPSNSTGYVDVLPLIGQVNGKQEYVPPVTLYHLPYSRIQGGEAALIIDPVVGDKGLAVFTDADASGVTADTTEPQQPSSYRRFSQSDGYYIGGFLNQKPVTFLELTQDKTAILTATAGVTINGTVTVNGDVIANGISLCNHVHGGVEPGGGSTGKPR